MWGGGTPDFNVKTHNWQDFCRNCMKMKEIGPYGRCGMCVPSTSLGSANATLVSTDLIREAQ